VDTKLSKKFYIFLILNALIWIIVSSLRSVVSRDSMEAIVWGELLSFGTNKHPPLSGWLAGGFWNLFGGHNIGIYVLGTLCAAIGLIYIYKLAKFFLDDTKSICASLIMSGCFYFSYHIFYDNFNCNILSMAFWPVLSYYFYKAVKFDSLKTWSVFGILAGFAFLAKYQVVILFLGMFLYLLICEREQFKKKELYLSILLGSIVILPHIGWLSQNDFFPMIYFVDRTHPTVSGNGGILLLNKSILCIKFYLDQLLALVPCFILYLIMALKEKNISFEKHLDNKKDNLFILLVGLLPVIVMGLSGFITGSRVIGAWGSAMLSFVGIMLFYYFPIKFKENSFDYFFKWIIAIALAWQIAMSVFAIIQTKIDMAYPYKRIMSDFDKIYMEETNGKQLKYVYGGIDYVFQFQLHHPNKPKTILETYGHKNPWINSEDVNKESVLLIDGREDAIRNYARLFLDDTTDFDKLQIKEYVVPIPNKLNNMHENEKMYYLILQNTKLK